MNIDENGKNINSAFLVVEKTYENIFKLFSALDNVAKENNFKPISSNFLRWKSDADYSGVLIKSFIKLYQNNQDPDCASGKWKNGPIYAIEIIFLEDEVPKIIIGKFKFKGIENFEFLPSSVSYHWLFYSPIRKGKEIGTEIKINEDISEILITQEKELKNYLGLERLKYCKIDLLDVNNEEEIKIKIIDRFKLLASNST